MTDTISQNANNPDDVIEGGCHCGIIRYLATALPFDADYCHCRDCQQTTGAPVAAWMDFQAVQISWLAAPPTEYASSVTIRRGFCAQCGATLSYRSTQHPDYLTLSIASLDDPTRVQPRYHIYCERQLPWFAVDDDLPRYGGERGASV